MSTTQALAARALTIVVAVVAMAMSYDALARRAQEAGLDWWLPWLYPLALDGLLGTGMLAAYVLRRARRRVRGYVWGVITFGIGVSVLGNALPPDMPGALAALFRAVPPISLALSLHLLIILSRSPERAVRRAPVQQPPEQIRADAALAFPAQPERSRTATARELLVRARSEGRSLSAGELSEASGLSTSSARRMLAEQRARAA